MLTAASDYKFIDTSNIGGMIHGNIMPVVSPQASAVAPVYFEDYLFLLEGFYERMNLDQAGTNNISPPPPTIYESNIIATEIPRTTNYMRSNYISSIYEGIEPRFISPDSTIISNPIIYTGSGDPNYDNTQALQNTYNDSITHGANAKYGYPIRPSTSAWPMWSEYIRARHWELERCSRVMMWERLGIFCDSCILKYYNSDGELTGQSDIALNNDTVYRHAYSKNNITGSSYVSYKYDLSYRPSIALPYAKSATMLTRLYVNSYTTYQQQGAIVPYQLTVQSGNIVIPTGLFESVAAVGCQFFNVDVTTSIVEVHKPFLIVDFEFPARLNGVNWNWQPLSS